MSKKETLFFTLYSLSFLLFFFLFLYVLAWQEPTQNPPGGNVFAPLNVSDIAQGKLGSLGIGISTPLSRLHLRDGQSWGTDLSLDAQGTTGGRRWLLISTGGVASEGQGKFLIKDNNANQVRLTIDTQGNVGIGTTAPAYKLDVVGALRLQPSSAPTGANGVIYYDSSSNKFRCYQNGSWVDCIGGSGVSFPLLAPLGSATNPSYSFSGDPNTGIFSAGADILSFTTGGTERMRINSSGNVGIGTTNPAYRLDISGDVRWSGTLQGGSVPWQRLTSFPSACPSGQFVTAVGSTLTCATPSGGGGVTGSGSQNYLAKWTGSTTLGNSTIYDTGTNVGIGKTNPTQKLDVAGNINFNSNQALNMRVQNSSSHPVTCDSSKVGFIYYKTSPPEGLCVCKTTGWSCSAQLPGSPGDKIVFVTQGTWNGNLGGIAGADQKCQQEAQQAGLQGTFVAWLSDGNIDAKDHIDCRDDKRYVLPNGTVVADNCSDLLDGTIDNPINVYANGQSAGGERSVWTGTLHTGIKTGLGVNGHCGGWSIDVSTTSGSVGYRDKNNNHWTAITGGTCNNSFRLYCFQL
jgi:hypothetical protein